MNTDTKHSMKHEINKIMKYYRMPAVDFDDSEDPIDYLSDCCQIESRGVKLTKGWYKDAINPYLAQLCSDEVIALIPSAWGYEFRDPNTSKRIRVNKESAKRIKEDALCFYIPFQSGKITKKSFFITMLKSIRPWDIITIILSLLAITLLGMFAPGVTKVVFSGIIPAGRFDLIGDITVLLLSAIAASSIISIIKSLILGRISIKSTSYMMSAAMNRVMSMPAKFFRKYPAGELNARLNQISQLTSTTINTIFSSGAVGIFSLLYIYQVANNAPQLVIPALAVLITQISYSILVIIKLTKRNAKRMNLDSKLSGTTLSMINGIQKIRLTGAENHMMDQWINRYKKIIDLKFNLPKHLLWIKPVNAFIAGIGIVVMYAIASQGEIPYANFITFTSAYGMLSAGVNSLLGVADAIANIKPSLDVLSPILENTPEDEHNKIIVKKLSGTIELNNLSFSYNDNSKKVVDNISLKIEPGQYVGICGNAGCGKSTLMKLMIGFEKPDSGTVIYDGYSIDKINLRVLRRQFGCVMQNAQLMQGSILQNISIGKPDMTEAQAWEAAKAASIADDIRAMPMGMHTVISHGGGGLSGGQKQRILIARALAGKPKIVYMDEATSALDNIAQAEVAKSMDKLRCTRVCIAHRLSTIKNCDRIIVLDGGHIVEDGTYDELIAANGRFSKLVAKQQL